MFIRTGDKVKIITGKEKGKEGTVIRIDRRNDRVVVKGLNMTRKHGKSSQTNQNDSAIEKEGSIHVSNVMLIDPESGRSIRVGHEIVDGNKAHIAKVSGKTIDEKQKGGS